MTKNRNPPGFQTRLMPLSSCPVCVMFYNCLPMSWCCATGS